MARERGQGESRPLSLVELEVRIQQRVPPPKGKLVCGNCMSYLEFADGTGVCAAKSVKFRVAYLAAGEASPACESWDENILLDLARQGIEHEAETENEE